MNKKNKFKTPILIIAWKRPKQTQELINKVELINPKNLYIACDGPRKDNEEDNTKVRDTREIILKSFKKVTSKKYLFSNNNDLKDVILNASYDLNNEKIYLEKIKNIKKVLEIYDIKNVFPKILEVYKL